MSMTSKQAKYCDPNTNDWNADHVDTQDTEVQELYRKGLEIFRDEKESRRRQRNNQDGPKVAYENISEKEATILRRLLRSGPPVKTLLIRYISLGAFKAAFHNLDRCPSLISVCVHVHFQGEVFTLYTGVLRRLHSLELSCENPGSGYANQIACYIRENKCLKELRLRNCCGGDEGADVIINALLLSNTLKVFALIDIKSSSDTLISFAKLLALNSTLALVSLGDVCRVEADEVWSLLAHERYAGVFQRLQIVWPDELLSVLTILMRRQACSRELSVRITSSVNKGILREFFEAVAESMTLRRLDFESDVFDEFASGIASVLNTTRTLRDIYSEKEVRRGSEHQMVTILNALKENTSVTEFTMYVETVTPEVATSLAELLAANKALREVHLCEESGISPRVGETILQGLMANYTLTELTVCSLYDDNDITRKIEALLNRNFEILEKAADFVISGGEQVGLDALKKVHSSADFVRMLKSRTKKTRAATLEDIRVALARVTV